MRRAIGVGGVVLGLVAATLAGCSASDGSEGAGSDASGRASTTVATATTTTTAAPASPPPVEELVAGRPYAVEHEQRTYVDASRATRELGTIAAAPDRSLPTEIYVPTGVDGPRPTILFAHGLDGHPDTMDELFTTWAEAGYVVVAPTFPITNRDAAPGGTDVLASVDVAEQPADVSFVLDRVLEASDDEADALLGGRVDPDRLGVSGLSLGGATAYGLVWNPCCTDRRFRAVEIFCAADIAPAPTPNAYGDRSVPLLSMHGDQDVGASSYASARAIFAEAVAPKHLVTVLGGPHYFPWSDEATPAWKDLVQSTTVDFWDAYLLDDPDALDRLATDAAVDAVSTVESVPS